MRLCEHCGAETSNPRFCSNSCRASVTNRGVRRRGSPHSCPHCFATVVESKKNFCSLECHREAENNRHVRRWLTTGVPGNHTLAGSVREFILMSQNYECAICHRAPEWNGMPLVFVLDHIDGDGSNHVRSNVRMICPNCDSQLPTFKARNRGKGRHSRRERYRAGLSY